MHIKVTEDDALYPPHQEREENLEMLKGKTLEVYYLLAKNLGRKFGVREVQRTLGYSSSSIAAYHLNRLLDYGLVSKTESGNYSIEGEPKRLGELEDHILVAGRYIPKILFYLYQAILSILVGILFFVLDVPPLVWFVFLILSNVVFIVILLNDARKILNKIDLESKL